MEDEHGSQRQQKQKQKLEKGGSGGVSSSRRVLLGKYEMGRLLGQGTFAKVYYGKHLKSGESVAIKVIKMEQVKKEGLMEQIKREISIMRLVRHPNVVELKEVMATKSKIYFIMEYVRGGELFAKVYKGKLKEDEARKYFQQLIRAVDFCHSRGVYHRDLKPENLLLDDKGDLKISDFGLSALRRLEHGELELLHTQCGTPAYVAPEVMRKKGYDGGKADIWSCGVILFVLLAGFLPFQDENIMRMYCKVFRAEFEFPPWFSADTKSLISKLLVADPAKRITISSIMQFSWFNNNNNKDDQPKEETLASALQSESELQSQQSPPFFNAFQLISSMSSGFDLSNLFEKKKTGAMFTSKCCVSTIMEKLESMAKLLRFKVGTVNGKELFKVKMQRREAGRKGKLAVEAQIFEVAPQVTVVEFSKSSGDTLEYVEFCAQEVRPALKDIVWTWQG